MKKFPKAAKNPNSRLRQARKEMEMLTALIGPINNIASTWLEGKVEEKKAQSTTKVEGSSGSCSYAEKSYRRN